MNKWEITAHPEFVATVKGLVAAVKNRKRKDPDNFKQCAHWKVLAQVLTHIRETIPSAPNAPRFVLRGDLKRIRRSKPYSRYRLFFSFSSQKSSICYIWLNDTSCLRKAGAKTDAYATFNRMFKVNTREDVIKIEEQSQEMTDTTFLATLSQ